MNLQIIRNPLRLYRPAMSLLCFGAAAGFIAAWYIGREKILWPAPTQTAIWAYTDADDTSAGNSTITIDTTGPRLRYSVTLGTGIPEPYAGVSIMSPDTLTGFLDFSGYNDIVIDCSIHGTRAVQFEYTTFVDNFTDRRAATTARYHISEIDNVEGRNRIVLPLSEMKTPSWWYSQNNLDKAHVPEENMCHVLWFAMGTGPLSEKGSPISYEIRRVAITKSRPLLLAAAGSICALWGLLLLLSFRPERAIPLSIRPINLGNQADEETLRLISWLGEHYDEAELTLSHVAKQAGLSTGRVTTLLDRHCHLSFKQYLTKVRLAEGARLLSETDRQVTEIAIAVGYQYPTSFNRTFREEYGCSPTDYRKRILAGKKAADDKS